MDENNAVQCSSIQKSYMVYIKNNKNLEIFHHRYLTIFHITSHLYLNGIKMYNHLIKTFINTSFNKTKILERKTPIKGFKLVTVFLLKLVFDVWHHESEKSHKQT